MFDATGGKRLQTIPVGPKLTDLVATPDAHYLVLASSDPGSALYVVDLVSRMVGSDSAAVRHLSVPGGVLAVATGAEISRAYATTGDGNLVYWERSDRGRRSPGNRLYGRTLPGRYRSRY